MKSRLLKRFLQTLGLVSPVTAVTFFIVWFVRNPAEPDEGLLLVFLIAVIVAVLALIPIALFLLLIRLMLHQFVPVVAVYQTVLLIVLFLAGTGLALLLAEVLLGQFGGASEFYSVAMLSAAVGGGLAGVMMATERR